MPRVADCPPYRETRLKPGECRFNDPFDILVRHLDMPYDGLDLLQREIGWHPDLLLTRLDNGPSLLEKLLDPNLQSSRSIAASQKVIEKAIEDSPYPILFPHTREDRQKALDLLQPRGFSLEQMVMKAERYYIDRFRPVENELYPEQLIYPATFWLGNLTHWRQPTERHYIHQLILEAKRTRRRYHEEITRKKIFGSEKGLYAARPEPVVASMACWRAIMGPETFKRVGKKADKGAILADRWTRTYRSEKNGHLSHVILYDSAYYGVYESGSSDYDGRHNSAAASRNPEKDWLSALGLSMC